MHEFKKNTNTRVIVERKDASLAGKGVVACNVKGS